MRHRSRLALRILGTALLMGLLGHQLIFRTERMGLNLFLWVATLAGCLLLLNRWAASPAEDDAPPPGPPKPTRAPTPSAESRWLLAGAVLFAGGTVWRASPLLLALDFLAAALCLGLVPLVLHRPALGRAGVLSYPLWLLYSAFHHISGPFVLLFSDIGWKEIPQGGRSKQAMSVVRGLLIALPLLALFGGLFAAADAVFADLVGRLFTFDSEWLFELVIGTLFAGALAAGFLRTSLLRDPDELPQLGQKGTFSLGSIEVGLVLGLLNVLFLAFVVVQVRYLFGGAPLVMAAADLTYAEYARRGFFELVQVTALVLPVLLALHWTLPEENEKAHRLFRWLGGSLVGLLFVIMASALQRMGLYRQEYGLTELRLYTTAFMGWLALVFVWFLATVLRGQRERFAVGALVSGFLVLAALHVVNPDALIARTNLVLAAETGRFDAEYAASLGPDAVPVLVDGLPSLEPKARAELKALLQNQAKGQVPSDWRAWNWGRLQAERALEALGPIGHK